MKLKWEEGGLKSPVSRARGLGSARDGVEHWINQRITALANIPLVIWLVFSIINISAWDFESFTLWLAQPINSILMILSVISLFYHAALGTQVVVEDYIHNEGFKTFKLVALRLFFFAGAVACIFSILKIAFTV